MKRSLLLVLATAPWVAAELPPGLTSWSPVVRAEAAKKAADAGTEALPGLLADLRASSAGTRRAATDAIAGIARSNPRHPPEIWGEITNTLLTLLDDDPEFWVRCGAAGALKVLAPPAAAPHLLRAAADSDPWVAAAAVDAIGGLPLDAFDRKAYLATAVRSLKAPRSATRVSAIHMLDILGDGANEASPAAEASVATLSQDSMFADRPRVAAIKWLSKTDRKKAATLANELLLERRWGAASRYRLLLPFLESLGADAAPAKSGLQAVVAAKRDPGSVAKAGRILKNLPARP